MTPRKVEHGCQPGRDQDSSSRPLSQKRQSQSHPREEASAKKGRTDSDNRPGKIKVRIDWANRGIGKPVPKPDSKHPSFKADPSGVDEPQPRMKSTVTKPKQPSETQEKDSGKKKEDAEKKVLQDKPHHWIEAPVKCLDLGGYPDEVKSLRYFRRNACDFAMGIVAIADWGQRYLDKGLKYPIPTIPPYLFTPLPESLQSGAQVPVKPSQLGGPRGDVCHRCRESWKWLVTVLQFWTDEATVADGAMYRGRVHPASALAQYVMDTVNPGLEPGSKVSWEDVITRTPWMSKRLHGMTTGQEQTVRRQALPMPGESSELEVLSEKLYTEYCKKMPSAGEGKSPLGRAGTLQLHLKKAEKGWTQASQSGTGPGVGNPNRYPKEVSSQFKQGKLNQPSRSPLTNELLDPGEELLGELDYETWKKSLQSQTRRLLKPSHTSPRWTFVMTWKCTMSGLLPGSNPKSSRPDTTLIWSARTSLNRAHLPRLRREKTGCWMLRKASPEHQETAGRVTIPTRPLTTKLPGHYFGPVSPKNQTTIS